MDMPAKTFLSALVVAASLCAQTEAAKPEAVPTKPPVIDVTLSEEFYRTQTELSQAQLALEHTPLYDALKKKQAEVAAAQKEMEDSPQGKAFKAAQDPAQAAYAKLQHVCAAGSVEKPKFLPSKGPDGKPVCIAAPK